MTYNSPENSSPEDSFPEPADESRLWTVWSLIGLFVGGILLGLVGAFLQAVEVTIGPVTFPIWMVILLATMAATTRAITLNYRSRKPAIAWFVGWLVTTLALSTPLPSGDQIVSDGVTQMIYVFGGAILGSAFVSLPAQLGPPKPLVSTDGSADESAAEPGQDPDAAAGDLSVGDATAEAAADKPGQGRS